ncbi:Scavenger mRNA decapping enzyme [Lotmaria passim]
MQVSQLCSGAAAAARRKGHAAADNGPRTKLPFLINVVKKAQKSANTATYKSSPPSTSSSSPTDVALAEQSFKPYPLLRSGEAKRTAESSLLYKDDTCILVNDAFPKSTVHCLVMPLELRLDSLNALTKRDVPLLRHMIHVGNEYVHFLKSTSPKLYGKRRFITGFHALPSLPMLHLHVLSMDLDSVYLKTKKHYNSFATFFFLTSERIVDDLERNSRVTINKDVTRLQQMENQDMKCLWCGAPLANIPAMKAHVRTCTENKSVEN